MRAGIAVVTLAVALALSLPGAVSSQQQTITIQDGEFRPNTLRVAAQGEAVRVEVRWTNAGSSTHTVTADRGAFNSGPVARGATFAFTFTSAGTFDYHCEIHSTMKGQVVIEAAAGREGGGGGGY
jgi:plastocyanin